MRALRVLCRPVFLAALVAGASLASYACGGRNGPGAVSGPNAVPPPTGGEGPACVDQLPLDDCVDYAIEREEVVTLLEDLEQARDMRSLPVAESALESGDPVVLAAGLRLLGPFSDKSEPASARALPLLASPYLTTQRLAAAVLERSPRYAPLANQYRAGHGSEPELDPWARALPVNLAGMGFPPPYPKEASWAPADSQQSAGASTTDPVDTVLAHYERELGKKPIEWAPFEASMAARTTKSFEDLGKQMQELQAEYVKTQDPKILEKMQELSKSFGKGMDSSLSKAPFPSAPTNTAAKVFVAEQDGDTPLRVVVVYPEPLVGRTVVMLAWSTSKYPPQVRTPKPRNWVSPL
jgi:hypothetical protein